MRTSTRTGARRKRRRRRSEKVAVRSGG